MTERDIPDSWSQARAKQPDSMTRLSRNQFDGDNQVSGNPASGSSSRSAKRRKEETNLEKLTKSTPSQATAAPGRVGSKVTRLMKSWVFWALLLALVPGSIGFMAMGILLKLPSAPNCPSIFWPLASASVRIHCAQLAASKQTINDLLQAIDLVRQLPDNHPLRGEVDRYIEDWSQDILKLASETFQQGKLKEAIAIARKIPKDLAVYKLVDKQINDWNTIWASGYRIYKQAEEHMRERRWQSSYMTASKLLRVDNRYWATTKYNQLNSLITRSREDGEKLLKAEDLAKTGGADNLVKAIELVESIQKTSYVYPKAQEAIPQFGRKMLDLAQGRLDRRDADKGIEIARMIPSSTGLAADTDDFITIAEAQRSAWTGSVTGLEAAIAQAQQVNSDRPIYSKAQQLIAAWQLEIQDVARLEKARSLASQGTISELNAAIAEVQLIPSNNPRARDARQEAGRWRGQIEAIEDRPYLDRAEQIALMGDTNSLEAAITEASQIRRGRSLYREAQGKIATWVGTIQRTQDQPVLDRARDLASSGDLSAAIATAGQISNGRALSREARSAINEWQGEIDAKQNWRQAREIALRGTSSSLAEAISIARRIPRSNPIRSDVDPTIDQWSQQILDIARSQSQSDLDRAIETARKVPRGTAAFGEARAQIREWRQLLNPEPPQAEQPSETTINTGQ
ncbi:MAG: chromosome segregation ATPase [Calothrix sp. SM1_7_51]|nr:chromosome segregation ATPase [Calothrix sp. SM1_7_51]